MQFRIMCDVTLVIVSVSDMQQSSSNVADIVTNTFLSRCNITRHIYLFICITMFIISLYALPKVRMLHNITSNTAFVRLAHIYDITRYIPETH